MLQIQIPERGRTTNLGRAPYREDRAAHARPISPLARFRKCAIVPILTIVGSPESRVSPT